MQCCSLSKSMRTTNRISKIRYPVIPFLLSHAQHLNCEQVYSGYEIENIIVKSWKFDFFRRRKPWGNLYHKGSGSVGKLGTDTQNVKTAAIFAGDTYTRSDMSMEMHTKHGYTYHCDGPVTPVEPPS